MLRVVEEAKKDTTSGKMVNWYVTRSDCGYHVLVGSQRHGLTDLQGRDYHGLVVGFNFFVVDPQ